jgi:predicted Zn-dependent protease
MRRSNITEVLSEPNRLLHPQGGSATSSAILSREEAEALVKRVVAMSKADGIDVQIGGGYTTNVRFADNQMSTAGAVTDFAVAVQSWFGKKHAVVQTNEISDAALRLAVEKSERLAKLAPDDPEAMPMLGQQNHKPVEAFFPSVAAMTAEDRARVA